MNIDTIKDDALRGEFERIAAMSAAELACLGLTKRVRDNLLQYMVLPEDQSGCWRWSGLMMNKDTNPRPTLTRNRRPEIAARVLKSLLSGKHIRSLLKVCHECTETTENAWCMAPPHLHEGTAKRNAAHRSKCRTLHGPRNGAVLHPEKLLRGLDHPRCPFKSAREIQALRARWHAEPDKWGMIAALMRRTGISKASVTAAIHGYSSIPDDPAAADDLLELDIRRPADRFGDSHGRSIMPEAAVELFYKLFNASADRYGQRRLLMFAVEKYGMSKLSLADIGHGRSRKKIAKKLDRIIAGSDPVTITDELLETLFAPHPPLRRKGEK
jgi:hypothetical protein